MCHPPEPGEPTPRPGVERQDVALPVGLGDAMPARVCLPEGTPWGSVVIATDIYGANRFYKDIAERETVRKEAAQSPHWPSGAPGRVRQENKIMIPASFSPMR